MALNLSEIVPEISSQLPNGYSGRVKKEAAEIIINDQSPHRVLVEGITIDGIESMDLDDGMWAERKAGGGYVLYVSIADPTEIIDPYSAIDIEALQKTTSVYLSTHVVHMLPPKISTDLASLNHHKTRLSLTVQIEYDNEMNVEYSDIYESKFYNKNRFDYDSFTHQLVNRDTEYSNQLNLLSEIGNKLFAKRLSKGAIDYDESDRKIGFLNKSHIGSLVVQEAAIAANKVASIFMDENEIDGIHRIHMSDYKGQRTIKNSDIERAIYSLTSGHHWGLVENNYAHFTSPIRRAPDFINHRQIKAKKRGDKPVYERNDLGIYIPYPNTQRGVIEILGRNYEKNIGIVQRNKNFEKYFEEQIEGFKIFNIKEDIRYLVGNGLKFPKVLRNRIVENILHGEDTESWSWALGVFLVSDEKEIIRALQQRVFRSAKSKYKKFLAIIGQSIVQRKDNRILPITETVRKVKGEFEYKITVKYLGKTIVEKKSRDAQEYISYEKGKLRKQTLEEIFEYFLKN